MTGSSLPRVQKLVLMHVDPSANAQKLGPWQIPFEYRTVFYQDGGSVLASVPHVDVGRSMVAILNFDEQSQKSTQLRHD